MDVPGGGLYDIQHFKPESYLGHLIQEHDLSGCIGLYGWDFLLAPQDRTEHGLPGSRGGDRQGQQQDEQDEKYRIASDDFLV